MHRAPSCGVADACDDTESADVVHTFKYGEVHTERSDQCHHLGACVFQQDKGSWCDCQPTDVAERDDSCYPEWLGDHCEQGSECVGGYSQKLSCCSFSTLLFHVLTTFRGQSSGKVYFVLGRDEAMEASAACR